MIMLDNDPFFDGRRAVIVNVHGAVSLEWARDFIDWLGVLGLHTVFLGNKENKVEGADCYIYFNDASGTPIGLEKYPGLDDFQNILANAAAVISSDVNVVKICVDMGLPLAFLATTALRPRVLSYEVMRAVKKRYPITLRERLSFIADRVVIDAIKKEAYGGKPTGIKEVPIAQHILEAS